MTARADLRKFFEDEDNYMRLWLWAHHRCSDGPRAFQAPRSAEQYLELAVAEILAGRHGHHRKGRSLFRFLCVVIAILIDDDAQEAADPN